MSRLFPHNEVEGVRIHAANTEDSVRWSALLTSEERMRAGGMANPAARARFIVSRGLRRWALSESLGHAPQELQFSEASGGKPLLALPNAPDFNVSHAGDFVVMACAGSGRVGIDLEVAREVREMGAIVRRYFHADEAAAWERLGPDDRIEGFFVLWSAREAAVKCTGAGLAGGLSVTRISPSILHDGEAGAEVGGTPLSVVRLRAPAGYVMVLARA